MMLSKRAYIWFSFPALFLHEASHVLLCLLTLNLPIAFKLNLNYGEVKYFTPKNKIVNVLINLSPIFNFIVSSILILVNFNFIWLLLYLLLTYKVSLPSQIDYRNIREF